MTPVTLMLILFAVVGVAAAVVLTPSARSWRAAAEHPRAFWLVWILGFTGLGFAAPAGLGPEWLPMAWFTFCVVLATLQPSMLADLVEIRRYRRLRRRRGRRRRMPAPVAVPASPVGATVPAPVVAARPRSVPAAADPGPPRICWRAPVSSARPLATTSSRS